MEFTFLENAIFNAFLLMLFPTQNSPPSSCHHALGRRKILIPPGSILLTICFPQQQKRMKGNYDLLYPNSVRKYEDDLDHYAFLYFG